MRQVLNDKHLALWFHSRPASLAYILALLPWCSFTARLKTGLAKLNSEAILAGLHILPSLLHNCGLSSDYQMVQDTLSDLAFLSVLMPLVPRMAAKESEAMLKILESNGALHEPDPNRDVWEPYFGLQAALRDRSAKAKPRSALKKPMSVTRQPGRK